MLQKRKKKKRKKKENTRGHVAPHRRSCSLTAAAPARPDALLLLLARHLLLEERNAFRQRNLRIIYEKLIQNDSVQRKKKKIIKNKKCRKCAHNATLSNVELLLEDLNFGFFVGFDGRGTLSDVSVAQQTFLLSMLL